MNQPLGLKDPALWMPIAVIAIVVIFGGLWMMLQPGVIPVPAEHIDAICQRAHTEQSVVSEGTSVNFVKSGDIQFTPDVRIQWNGEAVVYDGETYTIAIGNAFSYKGRIAIRKDQNTFCVFESDVYKDIVYDLEHPEIALTATAEAMRTTETSTPVPDPTIVPTTTAALVINLP